ncbi:MAG: flippase-like domain-containing protein [Ardenticatenaceae bacterium]|nr:flippase-like domain-containing protein [Ardenticatenaceae bacterium]
MKVPVLAVPASPRLASAIRLLLGLTLSALCLWLGLREVSLADLRATARGLDWWSVLLATALVALAPAMRAYRWQILFRPRRARYLSLLEAVLVGHMVNIAAPGRFGEVARLYLVGRSTGHPAGLIAGTVAVEKLLEIVGLVSFSLIVGPLLPLPPTVRASLVVLSLSATLILLLGLLSARFKEQLDALVTRVLGIKDSTATRWLRVQIAHVLSSLDVLRRGGDTLLVLAWTWLVWGLGAGVNWLAMRAMHLELPWTAAFVVLVTLQVGVALPSAPGKVGVFQALCLFALGLYGVPTSTAFSYGVLLYGIVFGPPLFNGVTAFLVGQGLRRAWQPARVG